MTIGVKWIAGIVGAVSIALIAVPVIAFIQARAEIKDFEDDFIGAC